MTQLHALIAVERGGVEGRAKRRLTDLNRLLATPAVLSGLTRRHHSTLDGVDDLPGETTLVQVTVPTVLNEIATLMTRVYDLAASKEASNAQAKADVIVDGAVLLDNVPVGALLFLEKRLDDIRTVVRDLPVLDPAEKWDPDANQVNVYRTPDTQTVSRKKVRVPLELSPATDHHAAQVTVVDDEIRTGVWTLVKYSGAISIAARAMMLDRVEKLIAAVKLAREKANEVEVVEMNVGDRIFSYVFGM